MVLQCCAAFVTLAAWEWESLVEFYRHFLGIEPQTYIPGIYAEFQLTGLRLGIFKPKASHQQEFAHQSKTGLSICLQVENLQAAITHLTNLGYPPSGEILTASHGQEIYAYDPAGNRLILYQKD